MRAAIYARVSTKDTQTNENQLEQLRAFAASQHWEIVREYADEESGKSADRTAFRDLFEDAARRRFDVVLFWSLDRFSREGALPTLQHLNRLTSLKVQFHSYTEQYLNSCGVFADAVVSILATIAKQERIRLSERTRAGLDRAKAQGKKLGRPKCRVKAESIQDLLRSGRSQNEAARTLGISTATLQRILQQMRAAR